MGSTARELVSELIARESAGSAASDPLAATRLVLQRVTADLCRFVGSDGCHALMTRARIQEEEAHPALKDLRISVQPELTMQGLTESIEAHGPAATAAGLESTLGALVDLLTRLIGDDLAMRLVVPNGLDDVQPDDAKETQ